MTEHRRQPSRFRLHPALLALWCVTACADGARAPGEPVVLQAPVDSIVLPPGAVVRVGELRLSFVGVQGDSRCPINVVCVWQGNAAVEMALAIGSGPTSPAVLNTADGVPVVEHEGYRVTLLGLAPAPRSTVQTPPNAYRASVRVETVAVD